MFVRRTICPTCKVVSSEGSSNRATHPFCSERCRTIDLGTWLTGGYRIATADTDEDLDEGARPSADPDRTLS